MFASGEKRPLFIINKWKESLIHEYIITRTAFSNSSALPFCLLATSNAQKKTCCDLIIFLQLWLQKPSTKPNRKWIFLRFMKNFLRFTNFFEQFFEKLKAARKSRKFASMHPLMLTRSRSMRRTMSYRVPSWAGIWTNWKI